MDDTIRSSNESAAIKQEEDDHDTDEEVEHLFRDDTWNAKLERKRQRLAKPFIMCTSRKLPPKVYQPSSLLDLTTQMVASNIEKYPPGALGILSEYQWDNIVRARVANKGFNSNLHAAAATINSTVDGSNKDKLMGGSGWTKVKTSFALDTQSGKKQLPALSEKVLQSIEQHPNNVHISKSKLADELLWKEIVDYKFNGIINRPTSLQIPRDLLIERLNGWSVKLLEIVSPPKEETDESRSLQVISSNRRTHQLPIILQSLKNVPMDVTLLTDTNIGKSVSKAAKVMRKLWKKVKNLSDSEKEVNLLGYSFFWRPMSEQNGNKIEVHTISQLEFLQKIIEDWKNMAADNGVEVASKSSASSPKKKQKINDNQMHASWSSNGGTKSTTIPIATCGKDKKISMKQHQIDMKLLNESPDWRSLYQSLCKREEMLKKSHGDRVRTIRDNLKKDRPTVGKVVLKKAVGRVRGGDSSGMTTDQQHHTESTAASGPSSLSSRAEKREAILSKSLGHRARQQQLSRNASVFASSGKISQLKSETKVAASWQKSSHHNRHASFGASVARKGIDTVGSIRAEMRQGQVHVKLQNGKSMNLPSSSAVGLAKSVGAYSSLQQKQKVKQGVFSSIEQKKRDSTRFNGMGNRKR